MRVTNNWGTGQVLRFFKLYAQLEGFNKKQKQYLRYDWKISKTYESQQISSHRSKKYIEPLAYTKKIKTRHIIAILLKTIRKWKIYYHQRTKRTTNSWFHCLSFPLYLLRNLHFVLLSIILIFYKHNKINLYIYIFVRW